MPAASRLTISSPGSMAFKRCCTSFRCLRFSLRPLRNRSKVDCLRFAMAYFLPSELARLGSVGDHDTDFPAGRAWPWAGQLATKQWTAATEVRLRHGHEGTKL